MFIPKKIVQDTLRKKSVKTNYVKEDTEDIVDTSTARLDATEETAASTFTPADDTKAKTILKKLDGVGPVDNRPSTD